MFGGKKYLSSIDNMIEICHYCIFFVKSQTNYMGKQQ